MASVVQDKRSGKMTVQFVGFDGRRRTISLGSADKRIAEHTKCCIEHLAVARRSGAPPPMAVAAWLASMPPRVREQLERGGLIDPLPADQAQDLTVDAWVGEYIGRRRDVKPGTTVNLKQAAKDLVDFLGKEQLLSEVTAGQAEDFAAWLSFHRNLAEGTRRRRVKRARQFFTAAIKHRVIADNPFADVPCGNFADASRFHFVTPEETVAVLNACPDREWRLIFALCRYGGLRCPSEVLTLKWEDVTWDRGRFAVHSSKTEHAGSAGGTRLVPIFAELAPHLWASYEEARDGEVYAVAHHRLGSENLRTQLTRIVRRAGVEPWPKLFQNLRSTRETELEKVFSLRAVCTWLGNSVNVAMRHYLQTTDDDWTRAAKEGAGSSPAAPAFPLQQGVARRAPERTDPAQNLEEAENGACCKICGDPDGTRTRVLALRGLCPNRWTTGPLRDRAARPVRFQFW